MKKIKLLLAAMAAMVTMGANAQSWTGPTLQGEEPVSGNKYFVYNVGADMFLSGGRAWFSWNTTAILSNTGIEWTFTGEAASFTLTTSGSTGVFTSGNNIEGDAMHVDNTAHNYGYTKLANGNYRIHDAGGNESSTCWGYNSSFHATGVVAHADATAEGWNCEWAFVTADALPLYEAQKNYDAVRTTVLGFAANTSAYTDGNNAASTLRNAVYAQDEIVMAASTEDEIYGAISELKTAGNKFLESVIITGGMDITNAWITNPAPGISGNLSGWTNSGNPSLQSQLYEYWNVSAGTTSQTLNNLPKGAYKLTVIAYTRDNMTATLYAGENTINLVGCGSVNDRNGGSNWIAQGNGVNNLEFTLDESTESLEIGLIADNTTGDHWMCWRSFSLTYYGDPINLVKAALAEAVAAAEATEGTIPAAAYNAIAAIVAENNKSYATVAEYTAAAEAINNAVSTYATAEIKAAYANYKTIKAAVEALDDDATIFTGDATLDLSADSEVEAATTVEGIAAGCAKLQAAATTFVTSVTVNEGKYFDMTNFWIVNPTVSQNTDGWNKENVVRAVSWGTGPTTNYGETEFYQSTFDFNQEVTLPKGTYEFGVTGFHRAGNHSTYFYAGEDKILIPGVESSVVNTMAEAKTYFDNGNGKVALKFGLEEESNTIKIGIVNNDTETDRWTIFRNFTIHYYGNVVDYSVYAARWDEAFAAANEAMNNAANANVTGSELTALTAAINDAPTAESKKADYNNKINALIEATSAFTAAAPAYDKYVDYKAETIALWGSDLDVAAPTTAAEATVAVQNLNIAQYNKVADEYTFSASGLIGDFGSWNGTATVAGEAATPNYLDWEHWSGETHAYYEQAASGWGNENGWTIQYQKICTLPAGDYVIKVAARSSNGVTSKVTCSALPDVEISLPCAGNNTRGINTSGVASWNADDIFISTGGKNATVGGTGAGWQWRFLPFSLSEQTEVTMTFYAEATTQYQWMSIADGELLSTTKLAQDVAYNETAQNTITNTIIADVTIARTIKEGYNTVVLPFDVVANDVTAAFGAGTEVYAFSDASGEDPEDATINFTKGDGSITANVPVLVKATSASTSQTFNGVQIVANDAKVEGKFFDFVGVYAPTDVEEDDWFIGNGALYESKGNTSIKAFRAYLDLKAPVENVKMFIDGLATRISEINGTVENGAIYNLAGQRVNNAQKGIFIVNGKKVVK